jgi:hypothetical protein
MTAEKVVDVPGLTGVWGDKSMRFTLEVGKWYACEIIGDEFEEDSCSYTPIRVDAIEPLGKGTRSFRLTFYHANYPEGVRTKQYVLRTLVRGEKYTIARSRDHNPTRILQIYDIDSEWLRRHFPVGEWVSDIAI